MGIGFESDLATGATYTLRAAYQKTWLNAYGAEMLAVAEIGNRTRLGVEFFQPLDGAQRFFVDAGLAYQRRNLYVFQDDDKLAELEVYELTGQLFAGARIGTLGQVRLGWEEAGKKGAVSIGPPQVPDYKVHYGGWFASIDLDRMDRIYLPRSGWAAYVRYLDTPSQGFAKLDAIVSGAASQGPWVVLGRASYVGSPVGQLPDYDPAKLGGFLNLSAFARDQLIGDNASYAGIRVERVIGTMPLGIRGDIRLGAVVEAGRMGTAYTETNLHGWQSSVGLYLGGETPLGAIFFGGAYSPSSGYSNLYFLFGTP